MLAKALHIKWRPFFYGFKKPGDQKAFTGKWKM